MFSSSECASVVGNPKDVSSPAGSQWMLLSCTSGPFLQEAFRDLQLRTRNRSHRRKKAIPVSRSHGHINAHCTYTYIHIHIHRRRRRHRHIHIHIYRHTYLHTYILTYMVQDMRPHCGIFHTDVNGTGRQNLIWHRCPRGSKASHGASQ